MKNISKRIIGMYEIILHMTAIKRMVENSYKNLKEEI